MKKKKPNPIALLPIVVFLVLYLGVGIYFEYIHFHDRACRRFSAERESQLRR